MGSWFIVAPEPINLTVPMNSKEFDIWICDDRSSDLQEYYAIIIICKTESSFVHKLTVLFSFEFFSRTVC